MKSRIKYLWLTGGALVTSWIICSALWVGGVVGA